MTPVPNLLLHIRADWPSLSSFRKIEIALSIIVACEKKVDELIGRVETGLNIRVYWARLKEAPISFGRMKKEAENSESECNEKETESESKNPID